MQQTVELDGRGLDYSGIIIGFAVLVLVGNSHPHAEKITNKKKQLVRGPQLSKRNLTHFWLYLCYILSASLPPSTHHSPNCCVTDMCIYFKWNRKHIGVIICNITYFRHYYYKTF